MLYDILKWPSEGTKFLRNIHAFVWVGAIYDKFFFTAYATLTIAHNAFTDDQTL